MSSAEFNPFIYSEEELIRICQNGDFVKNSNGIMTRLIRLTTDVVIKFGFGVTQNEAANQENVWKHSDPKILRVPRVYRFFTDLSKGAALPEGYLVMEYIYGQELATYLKDPTITRGAIDSVVDLIGTAVTYLSDLPKPDDQMPGPVSGGIPQGYLWSDCGAGTSFKSTADMEDWFNARLALHRHAPESKLLLKSRPLVMCHTDLAPRNISLTRNGGICFFDWADAGFYPYLFQVHAFQCRIAWEPIFAQILDKLPVSNEDRSQLRLLHLVQNVQAEYGTALQIQNYQEEGLGSIKQVSRPPLGAEIPPWALPGVRSGQLGRSGTQSALLF